jgi:hypothetical protein
MVVRKMTTLDKSIIYYSNSGEVNKMHNLDGAAYIPQGNMRLSEYYINGIRYSKEDWLDRKRDCNGLPWFKTTMGKNAGIRV